MSGTTSKEERRNLRKEMGAVAAAAVVELHGTVRTVTLEHRVLARQMADFEATVATVRQGRAADQARVVNQGARIDELVEQLEALTARYERISRRIERIEWWAEERAALSRWARVKSFFTGRGAVQLHEYPGAL